MSDSDEQRVIEIQSTLLLPGRLATLEPTPGFEPGTFSLPSGLWTLANSS
jgi:hypothetical protein